VKSLDAFEDLSVEDKAKVIGGLIAVGVAILGFVVFIQLFGAEYRLRVSEDVKSGSSMFTAMSLIIVVMYFFTIFPMTVVGGLAMGLLAKRSLGYCMKDLIAPALLVTGGLLFLIASLFSLFGVLFSNLSEAAQVVLMMIACLVSSVIVGSILKTKRFSKYIWKRNE